MALLGRIGSFDLKTDNITEYIERVVQYFIANYVTDEKKQTAVFLTIIGNETYSLLRNLLAPESPAGKTVKTLSETLIDHLEPLSIIIAERYQFYCRDRSENEIITEDMTYVSKNVRQHQKMLSSKNNKHTYLIRLSYQIRSDK